MLILARFRSVVRVGCVAWAVMTGPVAQAVIIRSVQSDGTPQFATARPRADLGFSGVDDPGWDHVGWGSNGTAASSAGAAIYLGNRWVLTAAHTVSSQITLGDTFDAGTTFVKDPGTASVRLKNPDLSDTDLVMFRLAADPGLTALPVIQATPDPGDQVILIGTGVDRDGGLQTFGVSGGVRRGYNWSGTRVKVWGTNEVDTAERFTSSVQGAPLDVHGLSTVFDNNLTMPEAQAADKDSGAALFVLTDQGWQLGGVAISVTGFEGQPDRTSVFGNRTWVADLSVYRSQIVALLPEPTAAVIMGCLTPLLLRRR